MVPGWRPVSEYASTPAPVVPTWPHGPPAIERSMRYSVSPDTSVQVRSISVGETTVALGAGGSSSGVDEGPGGVAGEPVPPATGVSPADPCRARPANDGSDDDDEPRAARRRRISGSSSGSGRLGPAAETLGAAGRSPSPSATVASTDVATLRAPVLASAVPAKIVTATRATPTGLPPHGRNGLRANDLSTRRV